MNYRKDIDGLRGLAVGSVLLFHADIPPFTGGFVGVDIFFVISGFLITSIIAEQVRAESFSLLDFYDRRIRRIFPPLIVVYLFSLAVGLFVAMPSDLRLFGGALENSAFFFSNHYFYDQTGYFDAAAHTKPLLHTWSLSVEEQFYVIWPLALLYLWRLPSVRGRLIVVGAGGLLSLALAEGAIALDDQAAAFYLLPMRAWELLLGALLALTIADLRIGPKIAEALAAGGIALIAASMVLLSPQTPFPGLNALLPCLGAACLIAAGARHAPLSSRLYTNRLVVGIGLISYSLYLWHWPLFSYWKLALDRAPTPPEITLLIAASLCLAILSYRYVEQPFRQLRGVFSRQRTVAAGVAAMLVCAGIGGVTVSWDGFPERLDARTAEIYKLASDKQKSRGCWQADGASKRMPDCMLGEDPGSTPVEVLLVGDSHAGHYAPALDRILKATHQSGQLLSRGGCTPLTGIRQYRAGREWSQKCNIFTAEIEKRLQEGPFKVVALAARWELYTEESWTEAFAPNIPSRLLDDVDTAPDDVASSRRVLERALRRMIVDLRKTGAEVVLMGQVPAFPTAPGNCVTRARAHKMPDEACSLSAPMLRKRIQYADDLLRRLAADYAGVHVFVASDAMCTDQVCSPFINGVFAYKDQGHLNRAGGQQIAAYVERLKPFADLRPTPSPDLTATVSDAAAPR